MYDTMSSKRTDNFTSSFLRMPLFPLFLPHHLAGTSGTLLSRNGESEYRCLVPDLGGKVILFSPLSMMFTVDLT